jgi:hypothetical protein
MNPVVFPISIGFYLFVLQADQGLPVFLGEHLDELR